MISEIVVDLTWNEPCFDSFEAAVAFTQKSPRTVRARQQNEFLKDTQILDYQHHLDAVELLLSNRQILRIACAGEVVEWTFREGEVLEKAPPLFADEVQLISQTGPITWPRKRRLDALVGIPFVFVAPTVTTLTVEVGRRLGVMFDQVIATDGTHLICFWED